MLDDLSPRSAAKLEDMSAYLELLRSNYSGAYQEGLRIVMDAELRFTAQQMLEAGVLTLKFSALAGLPYDPEWTESLARGAANITEEEAASNTEQQNWRPYTIRLWDVHHTDRPLEKEQFTGLCRAIYQAFFALKDDYENLIPELRDADPKRLGLVLQNETGKLVEDVAPPGAPDILARDYLDFLVEFYGGDYDKITGFINRIWSGMEAESEAPDSQSQGMDVPDPVREEQRKNVIWRARNFLKKGKIKLAIGQLDGWANTHKQDEYINSLIALGSEWNKISRESIQGITTGAETQRRHNQITNRLLLLIDEIERGG